MQLTELSDTIKFNEPFTLVKGLLYIKLLKENIILSDTDLNILCLFAFEQDTTKVINQALDKNYVRSWQTGENAVSRLVKKYKLLTKLTTKLRVCKLIPLITENNIAVILKTYSFAKL